MSLRAMVWALYDAPVENPLERLVLVVMADPASNEGTGSHLAVETIARRTMLGVSTVRRHRAEMVRRGILLPSADLPVSLLSLPEGQRPACFDLNMDPSRNGTPPGAGPKPTTTSTTSTGGSSTYMAAAALESGLQEGTLDSSQQQAEDDRTPPVTACNQDLQWTSIHLLRSWFQVERVEQVEAWRQAWKTGVEVAGEEYDPQTHLIAYLTRCHEQDRKPSPGLWLRFLNEDRQKWSDEQAAHHDRLEQQTSADGGEQWALRSLSRTPKWGDRA